LLVSARIVVGVGGGIAAYKAAFLVSRLAQQGYDVRVAMTPAATRFIGEATFSALSGNAVAIDPIDTPRYPLGPHIALAEGAKLMVIAPATAHLIGRLAHGMASCAVSTLYLQVECPVIVAPAMSGPMWEKPAVQRNVQTLQGDGVRIVGPATGWQSCRKMATGRMSEPEAIIEAALETLRAS
jgi:phosphopantothenoylcysteine decarboxylase